MRRYLPKSVIRIGRPIKSGFNWLRKKAKDSMQNYQSRRTLIRGLGEQNLSKPVGRVLICYVSPFIRYLCQHPEVGMKGWDPNTLPSKMEKLSRGFSSHTMWWESAEMVRQFIERGFVVDCIWPGLDDPLYEDVRNYDVIVDERNYLPVWALLNPGAKKLHYATGSHWIFHNKAELIRHEWLFARRGVAIPTARQTPPMISPGVADLISCFGNERIISTFGVYAPKVRKLWISAVDVPTGFKTKDWKVARNRFLWFGGPGWVHKGLDLVIEAFLREPQFHLDVCGGQSKNEEPIWNVYGADIEKAGNIKLRGGIDPLGDEFQEIVSTTCAIVCPSAAEGGGGSVVQCMHHGLIPLVTEMTGLDVHDTWPPLSGHTDTQLIEDIHQRCHAIAEMSEIQLSEWSHFFWEYAHKNHTRATYSRSFSNLLDELLTH